MTQKILTLGCALSMMLAAQVQQSNCNTSNASPSLTIPLPTRPFAVTATRDGCWVFVSGVGGVLKSAGIEVLKRGDGHIELSRTVPLKSRAALGMVLTHD